MGIETTDIYCVCGNTTGFQLSHNVSECTQCTTLITMDTPTYHTRYVKPLAMIAKEQAFENMCISTLQDKLDEWDVQTHDAWLEEQLESMYRRDKAGQDACAVMGSFDKNGDIADWSTCFEVDCIDDIPW